MTPKGKAKQLVDKFLNVHLTAGGIGMNRKQAKQCALIAVDEILKIKNLGTLQSDYKLHSVYQFYNEVKTEINKL